MIVVIELFTLAFIRVSPSEFGLEVVGFLGKVFFSEVIGVVSASVTPFEHIGGGYICVLEVVFVSIVTVRSGFGEIQRPLGVGEG